jgi:hypothetical protein
VKDLVSQKEKRVWNEPAHLVIVTTAANSKRKKSITRKAAINSFTDGTGCIHLDGRICRERRT